MKRFIHFSTYIIPLVFAALCLAWLCKFGPCEPEVKKADYANQGSIRLISEYVTLDCSR